MVEMQNGRVTVVACEPNMQMVGVIVVAHGRNPLAASKWRKIEADDGERMSVSLGEMFYFLQQTSTNADQMNYMVEGHNMMAGII